MGLPEQTVPLTWYPGRAMKPIVLVHGMYFGGWSWRKVAAPLRAAGITVIAVGDARAPGEMLFATASGNAAGLVV